MDFLVNVQGYSFVLFVVDYPLLFIDRLSGQIVMHALGLKTITPRFGLRVWRRKPLGFRRFFVVMLYFLLAHFTITIYDIFCITMRKEIVP